MIEASETEVNNNSSNANPNSEELSKTIQTLEDQVKEKENKYLYLYAEFENFKKRAVKERSDLIKFGWESVARELLGTLDNLELALQHAPATTDKPLLDGLKMVHEQFKESLQKQGVKPIESLQKPFDPHLHEAIGQEKSTLPQGTIVQEQTKGYTLHGRLLRPTRVIVSDGRGGQEDQRNDLEMEKSS